MPPTVCRWAPNARWPASYGCRAAVTVIPLRGNALSGVAGLLGGLCLPGPGAALGGSWRRRWGGRQRSRTGATHDDLSEGGHRLIQLRGVAQLGLFVSPPDQAEQRVDVGTVRQRAIQGTQPFGDRADAADDALFDRIQPVG